MCTDDNAVQCQVLVNRPYGETVLTPNIEAEVFELKTVTLQELVDAANRGDAASLKSLRQVLDEHPEIWQKAGDLAAHAETTWTRLMAAGNALALESLRREADRMRAELLAGSQSPIERLLVDQVVSCWLQAKHAEISAGLEKANSLAQKRYFDQRMEKTQRRYLSALKMLAQIRRLPLSALMPRTSVPTASPTADNLNRNAAETAVAASVNQPPVDAPSASPADRVPLRIFQESETRRAV